MPKGLRIKSLSPVEDLRVLRGSSIHRYTVATPTPRESMIMIAFLLILRKVKISKYAWDQSEKFVSVYVDFPGVGALPSERVVSIFEVFIAFIIDVVTQHHQN